MLGMFLRDFYGGKFLIRKFVGKILVVEVWWEMPQLPHARMGAISTQGVGKKSIKKEESVFNVVTN